MEPPVKPNESDCCNSGCNPCIFDVYEEQLKKYQNQSTKNKSNLRNCLSPTTYTIFTLISCKPHTHNSKLYVFQYKGPFNSEATTSSTKTEHLCVSYKPGQYLLMRSPSGESNNTTHFTRAYTPIPTNESDKLTFTVLIKLYEGGLMSRIIDKLLIDSETLWRGPYGDYEINYSYKHSLCIAQGTGLAPIYYVIREMLQNENCETFIQLLFCCKSMEDVLLRNELQECSRYWNFNYELFLSQENALGGLELKYNEVVHKERLSRDFINDYFVNKSLKDVHVMICGSDAFIKEIRHTVVSLNVGEEQIYSF